MTGDLFDDDRHTHYLFVKRYIGTADRSETLIAINQTTRRHIPQNTRLSRHCGNVNFKVRFMTHC